MKVTDGSRRSGPSTQGRSCLAPLFPVQQRHHGPVQLGTDIDNAFVSQETLDKPPSEVMPAVLDHTGDDGDADVIARVLGHPGPEVFFGLRHE